MINVVGVIEVIFMLGKYVLVISVVVYDLLWWFDKEVLFEDFIWRYLFLIFVVSLEIIYVCIF